MFNTENTNPVEPPSARKLLISTLIAFLVAVVLLVTVVMPAEYALDPTGAGRLLGLTEMGEIKGQLAEEAAADLARDRATADVAAAPPTAAPVAAEDTQAMRADEPAPPAEAWQDEMQVVLQPGEGAEIKLTMKAGEQASFQWTVEGGVVNFDTHGDGGGQAISYEKGRGLPSDEGVLEAAFDGSHGWFWRNRGMSPVTVVVRVRGQYADVKRLV